MVSKFAIAARPLSSSAHQESSLSEHLRSTLSVILPNYNHGQLLGRAVAALLQQEKLPDEIIIVDDGSTDDSSRIIHEIKSSSSTVRVLFNDTNKGVVYSLNRGLEASSSKYVYLAAADDWVLPGFFINALRLLECHPESALACGEVNLISGATGESLGMRPAIRPSRHAAYLPPEAVVALLKRSDNWIVTGATILARERVVAAGGLLPELGSFADGFLVRKLALLHGFCYMPELVATWQVFENSVSRQTASNPAEARRILLAAVAHFNADPRIPRWYGAIFSRRWNFAVSRLAAIANPVDETVLSEMGIRNWMDRLVVRALCRLKSGAMQRSLLLTWLWFRFMPLDLTLLFSTFLSRRL